VLQMLLHVHLNRTLIYIATLSKDEYILARGGDYICAFNILFI
jgi:hypothetical protein